MRYANPSIKAGIDDLLAKDPNIDRIVAVPLFTRTTPWPPLKLWLKKHEAVQQMYFPNIAIDFVDPFYKDQRYIDALAGSIQDHLTDKHDYLLFSYHGVPVRHLKKTDPTKKHCFKIKDCCFIPNPEAHPVCYAHQVKESTNLVMNQINMPRDKWSWAFQSRLGLDEWLQPFADDEIERLAKSGC